MTINSTNSYKEFMAELIGTMFILLFGNGVNAMNELFNLGGYTNITFSWGLGVFLGILVSNRITGAHLNPAVTIALVITKRFPFKKTPLYISAQMLGGFIGAALVYYFYQAKFAIIDPSLTHSAGIFTTFPAVNAFMPGFVSEIIASAILMFGILSITENFINDKAGFLAPFAVGALIVAIGMSFGGMHGYAMNPARDFSPRLFIALMGFAHNGLTDGSNIWIVGVLGPIIGTSIGAIVFNCSLAYHKPIE
ncbi:MAG: aquaporin family protein [Proteobacteria bacterium]|jgi:glycerol uptake facilitator protein|nr:aquaporin family protein [Pseudomonadota bacterium]